MIGISRFSLAWIVTLSFIPIIIIKSGHLGLVPATGTLHDVLLVSPFFLLAVTGFLGARLAQPLILFSCFLFGLSYLGSSYVNLLAGPQRVQVLQAASLALPLITLILIVLKPGRLLGRNGLFYILAILIPGLVLAGLVKWGSPEVRSFLFWHETALGASWQFPLIDVLFWFVLVIILGIKRDRYLSEFYFSLTGSLLSLTFLIHHRFSSKSALLFSIASAVTFSVVSFILLYATYRIYWRKVYIDELTGLPNRRSLDEKMIGLRGDYVIAMADIDFFKKFNDEYGHDEGDNVLRFVAGHLDRTSRGRAFRFGGEEFCIVCEGMEDEHVKDLLEHARVALARSKFYIRSSKETRAKKGKKNRNAEQAAGPTVRITLSFGASKSSDKLKEASQVIKVADEHLYKAKNAGRNCIQTDF